MIVNLLMFAHVFTSLLLIVLVLLQRSEGGLGSLGGGGGDALVSGAAAGDVLSRITKWFFIFYVILTMGLAVQMAGVKADESVVDKVQQGQGANGASPKSSQAPAQTHSQSRPVVPDEVQ